jgi:hypothetical protein
MKFLANEKLTLYTSLNEPEVLEMLKSATEPAHPLVPIIHGVKPFIGTISGPLFDMVKRNEYLKGLLSLYIKGRVEPARNGSSLSVEFRIRTVDWIAIALMAVFLVFWLAMSVLCLVPGNTSIGSGFRVFCVMVSFFFVVNSYRIFRGIRVPKKARKLFMELLQAQEITDANQILSTHE